MDRLSYSQLGAPAKRNDAFVETTTTELADGWLRIEPRQPMAEGEYCILPVPSAKGFFSSVVYDFGINLEAPNEKDAIAANVVP